MGALIAAAVVAAAGSVAGGVMANNAAKDAAGALNNAQRLDLQTIPNPETVDWQSVIREAIGRNAQNLPMTFDLANRVNNFQVGQAMRGYERIQPYFKQNQELIGRNVASFARGELPSDVVSSIGRAAAQRGIQGGFGLGVNAGGPGSALGALNLRNLGLTSLDLSRTGTGMAMDANSRAAAMTPALFDPTSMFVSPNMALGIQQYNTGVVNDWNRANTAIRNAEASGNVELANAILQEQTGLRYQGALQNAQAVQGATNIFGNLIGGGMMGGGGMGAGNQGQIQQFNNANAMRII